MCAGSPSMVAARRKGKGHEDGRHAREGEAQVQVVSGLGGCKHAQEKEASVHAALARCTAGPAVYPFGRKRSSHCRASMLSQSTTPGEHCPEFHQLAMSRPRRLGCSLALCVLKALAALLQAVPVQLQGNWGYDAT